MTSSFVRGSIWELTVNANCIPAGRYTFVEEQGEFLLFSVGKKITFGLTAAYYKPFLKPILGHESLRRTRAPEFIEEYARLLANSETYTANLNAMTFCLMEPSLTRRLKSMSLLQNTFDAATYVH